MPRNWKCESVSYSYLPFRGGSRQSQTDRAEPPLTFTLKLRLFPIYTSFGKCLALSAGVRCLTQAGLVVCDDLGQHVRGGHIGLFRHLPNHRIPDDACGFVESDAASVENQIV